MITTAHPEVPGSSGRTCSASWALSNTTSIRLPASMLRYLAARSSVSAGMSCPGTPRARRKPASASPAVTSWPGS